VMVIGFSLRYWLAAFRTRLRSRARMFNCGGAATTLLSTTSSTRIRISRLAVGIRNGSPVELLAKLYNTEVNTWLSWICEKWKQHVVRDSGRFENSPALQHWVRASTNQAEAREAGDRVSAENGQLQKVCRPFHGLASFLAPDPSAKALGYFHFVRWRGG
jgi:hypothetical protein